MGDLVTGTHLIIQYTGIQENGWCLRYFSLCYISVSVTQEMCVVFQALVVYLSMQLFKTMFAMFQVFVLYVVIQDKL